MKEDLDDSDIRACGGFLPLGRTGLAGGTLGQTENGAGLAGGTLETEDRADRACGTLIESSAGAGDVGRDDRLGGAVIADCGEAVRVRRPPTAACGGTSPTSQRFFAVN
jgi:hypothetical protein